MDEIREAVAATARRCVRAGLIRAFGHVSSRHGDRIVITGTRPLAACRAEDTIVLAPTGAGIDGPVADLPLEVPMHLAVYRARPDVGAICRGHPPAVVRWGVGVRPVPLRHGLGAIAGRVVPVHLDVGLVTDDDAGSAVTRTLGIGMAVVLRGNGALTVGADTDEAATRMWFLDERADVAAAAQAGDPVDDDAWDRRVRHTAAELARARDWFIGTYDDPPTQPALTVPPPHPAQTDGAPTR